MSAKIKTPARHHSHSPRPRGTNHRAFEKVYWPYIPVVIAFSLLLPLSISTGALSRFVKNPSGKVLSYAISQNVNSMLVDTNQERLKNSEPSLKLNDELSQAATAKAQDMAKRNYWSHNTPEGNAPWSFVTATGYSYQKLGENLAAGFSDENEAVKGWMASPPHRENLLDPNYTQVGFGFANAPNYTAAGGGPTTIFVAFYGEPSDAVPILSSRPVGSSLVPSTLNPTSQTLSAKTSELQASYGRSQLTTWFPVVLALGLLTIVALLAGKHYRMLRKAFRSTERFAWHHPLFDLSLLVIAAMALMLWRTAGFIQ